MITRLIQKAAFRLRHHFDPRTPLRRLYWSMMGARFGASTHLSRISITWPHQVRVGAHCNIEDGVAFKYDGFWKPGPSIILGDRVFVGRHCEFNITERLEIGDDCLIAAGVRMVDHDHGIELDRPMNVQACPSAPISVGADAWIGANAVILKGVTVGRGAIIGAGAVVTRSIPDFEIWAGVPARRIGSRLSRKPTGVDATGKTAAESEAVSIGPLRAPAEAPDVTEVAAR